MCPSVVVCPTYGTRFQARIILIWNGQSIGVGQSTDNKKPAQWRAIDTAGLYVTEWLARYARHTDGWPYSDEHAVL